jgi:hypothetical protein
LTLPAEDIETTPLIGGISEITSRYLDECHADGRKSSPCVLHVWRDHDNFLGKTKESFVGHRLFSYLIVKKMKSVIHFKFWPVAVGTSLLVAFAGCGRDNVKVYHTDASDTANPTPLPDAAPVTMSTTVPDGLPMPDNNSQPSLQYTLPAGWEKKALSPMRVASFGISQDGKQADVSVIPLGGMAGTDPANVNRWRGQVGLGPQTEAEASKLAEKVSVGAEPADLYDLAGTTPGNGEAQRILGVILHRDDTAWFFKMTGEAGLVEQQKPTFIAFLKTISFGAPTAAPSALDLSQLPPSHPPIAGTSLGTQNFLVPNANTLVTGGMIKDSGGKSIWTIPADWKQIDPGTMLFAKFSIAASDGKAEVNILSAGEGGSLLENVTRWRGQLGLPPVTQEDELSKMVGPINGAGNGQIVDFTGTDAKTGKPARLVGAIVSQNDQTWFYKLMGDEQIVAQQKDAFIQFVQSAKYPDAR